MIFNTTQIPGDLLKSSVLKCLNHSSHLTIIIEHLAKIFFFHELLAHFIKSDDSYKLVINVWITWERKFLVKINKAGKGHFQ